MIPQHEQGQKLSKVFLCGPLRVSAFSAFSALKLQLKRRGRRDTQRAAEKVTVVGIFALMLLVGPRRDGGWMCRQNLSTDPDQGTRREMQSSGI